VPRSSTVEIVVPFASVRKWLAFASFPSVRQARSRLPRDEQPEVDARDDSIVVEGDDRDHVLPPTELDPYTPDPTPPERARAAMWIALAILAIVIAVVVYAALR
jgi:hypothetical protein